MQTETTEKENPEKVGWVFNLCGVEDGGEGSACKGASLVLLYIAVWTGMVACCCHPRVLGGSRCLCSSVITHHRPHAAISGAN